MATVAAGPGAPDQAPAGQAAAVRARRRVPSWILLVLSVAVAVVLAAPLVFLLLEARDSNWSTVWSLIWRPLTWTLLWNTI